MTTTIDDDSFVTNPTTVTNSDSPYTTSGEQYIYADTSTGAITITLASADTEDGREIRVIDTGTNASSNNITIDTEGSESINPGSNSSITLTVDGTYVDLFSDGSNWFSDRASEKQTVSTEEVQNKSGLLDSRIQLDHQTPVLEDWERETISYYGNPEGTAAFSSENVQGSVSIRTDADGSLDLLSPFETHRGVLLRSYFRFDPHSTQDVQLFELRLSESQGTAVSSDTGYRVRVRVDANSNIARFDSGVASGLASTSTTPPTDEWLVLEWEVEYGNLVARVKQLDGTQVWELSAADATHQTGPFYVQYRLTSDDTANGNHTYTDVLHRRPL